MARTRLVGIRLGEVGKGREVATIWKIVVVAGAERARQGRRGRRHGAGRGGGSEPPDSVAFRDDVRRGGHEDGGGGGAKACRFGADEMRTMRGR